MELDALLLARLQFAITIGFHFLFPPTSIGLAWFLVWSEWRGWRGRDPDYVRLSRFFAGILGLTFAVGVATGVVMEFQFGMNWARYSEFVGDVFGAPLAAEGIMAFFLESSFLGLYLFGRGRVSPAVHWVSCLLVAVGATLSAFWILVANSWQQTPAGFVIRDGRAQLTDFGAAVFNPSMWPRFLHQMSACLVVGAFVVAGIAAWLLLRRRETAVAIKALRAAVLMGLVSSLATGTFTGHMSARNVARYQPAKLAAIEGLESTQTQAPLLVFGVPTATGVRYAVRLPGLLSLLATDSFDGEVKGLDAFPPDELPPQFLTFTTFHLMVGLGLAFIVLMAAAAWQWRRGRLADSRRLLWLLVVAMPLPLLANQLGWITAEVGRQPWIVYGHLRTAAALSATVKASEILTSILLFSLVYVLLGVLYLYLLVCKIRQGPPTLAKTPAAAAPPAEAR